MKIIAPIRSENFLDKYIDAGADEFYGGIFDEQWQEQYGDVLEYNRRGNYAKRANISDWGELSRILEICGLRNKPFYLTANALHISGKQQEDFCSLMLQYQKLGGEKVIISDLTLIPILREMGFSCTVSSCAGVRNRYSAQLFQELGCERIILPRDITIREIHEITHQVNSVEYEVFLTNSGCRYLDGHCLGLHTAVPGALCDYCKGHDSRFFLRDTDGSLNASEQNDLQANKNQYNRLFRKACALCMIYDLADLVDSVKIVGRVADEEGILEDIRQACQNRQIAEQVHSRREYLSKMIKGADAAGQCVGYMNCYYRSDMRLRDKELRRLEDAYSGFLKKFPYDNLKSKVEYVGINLTQRADSCSAEYKLYFNHSVSMSDKRHPLVKKMQEMNMLRTLTQIQDTVSGEAVRYDIGLKNRTRESMKELLSYMASVSALASEHLNLIESLNDMCVSTDTSRDSTSLYFFGFIEQDKAIKAIKPHYLTRKCADPDQIDTQDRYDDSYYIEYLRRLHIEGFERILPFVMRVLETSDGHLWMLGTDFFSGREDKYKIYIKCREKDLLAVLRSSLRAYDRQSFDMVEKLEMLELWLEKHPELSNDGVAVSQDSQGKWCLNFYLKWK